MVLSFRTCAYWAFVESGHFAKFVSSTDFASRNRKSPISSGFVFADMLPTKDYGKQLNAHLDTLRKSSRRHFSRQKENAQQDHLQ
jgi:hypothetical protein